MTNEERAREAATEIAKADPDWDTHAEIILAALNAATASVFDSCEAAANLIGVQHEQTAFNAFAENDPERGSSYGDIGEGADLVAAAICKLRDEWNDPALAKKEPSNGS